MFLFLLSLASFVAPFCWIVTQKMTGNWVPSTYHTWDDDDDDKGDDNDDNDDVIFKVMSWVIKARAGEYHQHEFHIIETV